MESANWAPAHADALKEYLVRGLTYSEVARAINAKFNTAYSRSAVIGRARRSGLARLEGSIALPSKQRSPDLRKMLKRYALASGWVVPAFERVESPKLRCVEIDPRHLSLIELERGDCRYPYGGDEEGEAITFCGHPRRERSSYCTAHFHLTQGPGAVTEATVGTAFLRVAETA